MTNNPLNISDDSRPTRADAVKNRALLLDTAKQLMSNRPIDDIPMSDVAKEAGVGKGTLYRHFRNKVDLCQALLDQEQQALQTRTLERLRTHPDPLDNLRWFLVEVLRFVCANTDLLSVSTPDTRATLLEHPAHVWWRQTIRGLLGQVTIAGDVDYISDVLYLMIDGKTVQFQKDYLGYSETRIVDGLMATLMRLIA